MDVNTRLCTLARASCLSFVEVLRSCVLAQCWSPVRWTSTYWMDRQEYENSIYIRFRAHTLDYINAGACQYVKEWGSRKEERRREGEERRASLGRHSVSISALKYLNTCRLTLQRHKEVRVYAHKGSETLVECCVDDYQNTIVTTSQLFVCSMTDRCSPVIPRFEESTFNKIKGLNLLKNNVTCIL